MVEWKKLLRSIRYETPEIACDVWSVVEEFKADNQTFPRAQKGYRFTVYDYRSKSYTASGIRDSEDKACEAALKEAGI